MNPPDWLTDPDGLRIFSATVAELTRRRRVVDPERVAAYSYCMASAVRWQAVDPIRVGWIGYSNIEKAERWIKRAHWQGQNPAAAFYLRCADYCLNGYLRPARRINYLELLMDDHFDELGEAGEVVNHWGGQATRYLKQEWEITR